MADIDSTPAIADLAPLEGIAVVGLAGRFPGALDVRRFWRNLCEGVESISQFSPVQLDDAFTQAERADASYIPARSVLDGVDMFEPGFFGMLPREATLTDPQHRVFLECCWEALEDAGHDPAGSGTTGSSVGVFAGCSMPTYLMRHVFADRGAVETFASGYQVENYQEMLGSLNDVLATRVSYKLDLRGPSMTVQTACSTSLVAVIQACQSLMLYQCDMALAGGVSITFPQQRGYRHNEGGMVSADGHCRPFDAAASGTVFGSGCGVVALKRLADAVADGDNIYAVVKGFAVNNDGASKIGFTGPSVDTQAAVIVAAQEAAGVSAGEIGYVECHGTATPLGDPIEVAALTRAFHETTRDTRSCAIGSVKGNIGHLDCAAGVTGLIKAVLAVREGVIPPTLHFQTPNPQLHLDASPFFVANSCIAWPTSGVRRAGVSALGVGGTNAHLILEQAPANLASFARSRPRELLVLSARSPAALASARTALSERLLEDSSLQLGNVAHTLRLGRRSFAHRCAIVARDTADAASLLAGEAVDRAATGVAAKKQPPVLLLFPGQGSQYVGMGQDLYRDEPVFRAELDRCADILLPLIGQDLRQVLYGKLLDGENLLQQTMFAQPAIFAVSYSLAHLWMSWGVQPVGMIGHSIGEFVAACLAGVFRLEDALAVVATRGRLMQNLPGGAMLVVRLPEAELLPLLSPKLNLAAVNGPALCVVSGPDEDIAALEQMLQARSAMTRRLRTSHAFHSSMMDPVLDSLAELIGSVKLGVPRLPYVSCVTGDWITTEMAGSPDYWGRHCREPVRFADGLATLLGGQRQLPVLLEVGAGSTLSSLAYTGVARTGAAAVVPSLPDPARGISDHDCIQAALGRLWIAGVRPDWAAFGGTGHHRVSLPTYPFERTRHWIDVPAPAETAAAMPVSIGTAAIMPAPSSTTTIPLTAAPRTLIPSPAPGASVVSHSRDAEIGSAILATLEELSGDNLAESDPRASFLEMGFDSLLLSQAAQEIQRRFGIKITFRQLLGEQSTVRTLTKFISSTLLEAAAPAAATSTVTPCVLPTLLANAMTVPPVATLAPWAASDTRIASAGAGVEGLLHEQLQTMQRLMLAQLDTLRALGSTQVPTPTAVTLSASATPIQLDAPPKNVTAPAGEVELTSRFSRFSKTAPVIAGGLTEAQRRFIDDFTACYTMRTARSKAMTQASRSVLADPRAASGFRAEWKEIVYPIVCDRAAGSRLWDIDGNEYIDLVNGFGSIAFGHSPDFVVDAVAEQLRRGFAIGPQSEIAGDVAALFTEMTGDERVTFCCTGSEAVMGALRLARAVTGRKRVVAFAGAYHGGFDEVLVRGIATGGEPRSLPAAPGIPGEAVTNLTILEYGEPESLRWIATQAPELAAVLVEPVQSRHPDLQPSAFLQELRAITEASGSALIFDEVVTGFRLHPGGAQALFGIRADLATYGKVVGGGLPIGILAGKPRFMDALDGGAWQYGDGSGPVAAVTVFAGTFVRHPLALAAAKAVLMHLKKEGSALQQRLGERTARVVARLNASLAQCGVRSRIECCGSMFHFNPAAEDRRASLFFHLLRSRGIHAQENFPLFLTTAHTDADLEDIITAFEGALNDLQSIGILARTTTGEPAAVAGTALPVTSAETQLTEPQVEIWLSAQLGDNASCAYNESFSLELAGPLDRTALLGAVEDLVARHDALRAHFSPTGDRMIFKPLFVPELPEQDLSAAVDQTAAFAAILAEEAHTPFDLAAGPLMRVRLARRNADDHVLVLTCHHIICDGWSTNVMISDLAACYEARLAGARATLPPAPSFAEHSIAERGKRLKEATADEAYWVACFADLPEPLNLPADRLRPATKSFRGATVRETISADLFKAVRTTGVRYGCTPFAALLAAFHVLIGRLAGQSEAVVGVPTAGQALLDRSALVGHCVNFLPIRGCWEATTTLIEHMTAVQKELAEAREHPRCTLGTLVRRLAVLRTPNRVPLTDVQFNLERMGAPTAFGGLRAAAAGNPKAYVNFDLFFNLVETGHGLRLECDYSTDLFDEATVRRWISHYKTLLSALTANAAQPVIKAPLLTDSERLVLLQEINRTEAPFPADRRFHQLFEAEARRWPDAIAVECGEERLTYGALERRACDLVTRLRACVTGQESRIGVLMERSTDLLAGLLAVAKAGFTYVPLDPYHPLARLQHIVEQSGLAALLTDGSITLPTVTVPVIDLSRPLYPVPIENDLEAPTTYLADSLAYVIYTSGSTGIPKGVEVSHRALTNLLAAMMTEPGIGQGDTLLAVTTVSFDIAALELFLPLCVGARVVIAKAEEANDGFALLARLQASGTTILQATPATWRMLLEAGFKACPGMKLLCGGEALPRDLADNLLEGGGELWNMYGPTETTIWSSCSRVFADEAPITIGRPIANTQFYILDQHGEVLPPGVPGELHIGGAGVACGYAGDLVQTAAKFVANPFKPGDRMYRTGDLVRRTPNGIQMLGRLDHQVKLRGFRIELGEIETAVCAQGGAAVALAMLRADPPRPVHLVCYYLDQPGRPCDAATLQASLAKVLPDYMVPSAWVKLNAMPLTPNGKIDRKALPAPNLETVPNVSHVPLTTPTQQRLGDIWREVLGVLEVGANDDVLALGADSVHLFQIAARATRSGISVAVKDLLRYRNIGALTEAMETSTHEKSAQAGGQNPSGPPRLSQFRRVREH